MPRAFLSAIKSFLLLVLLASPSVAQEPIREPAPAAPLRLRPQLGVNGYCRKVIPPVQTEPPTSQQAAEDSGWTPGEFSATAVCNSRETSQSSVSPAQNARVRPLEPAVHVASLAFRALD
jgi:hypothetical protein